MKQISDMRRKSLTEDYEYLRNTAVPNLKRELSEYEIKVATYEDEVVQLRSIIKSRDDEILKLKTEIHKLKVRSQKFIYIFIVRKCQIYAKM